MVGLLLAFLVMLSLFITMLYIVHYRNRIGRFRRRRSPDAILRYDEDRIGFSSDLGESVLPWSAISEVWKHDRFWLLLFSPALFVTLPLDSLGESARAFIIRKVEGRTEGAEPPPELTQLRPLQAGLQPLPGD